MSHLQDNRTFGADLTAGQKPGKSPPDFSGLSRPGTAGHQTGQNRPPPLHMREAAGKARP
jgi:hypothetical protein